MKNLIEVQNIKKNNAKKKLEKEKYLNVEEKKI